MKRISVMLVTLIACSAIPSFAQTFAFTDKGAGMYTDGSVVHQASTFTLNPNQVSCGVGTIDANGAFGPFEMEMASYTVDSYSIDRTAKTITATGHMRSTTRVAGLIIEDTNGVGNNPPPHAYVAIGHDGRGGTSGLLGLLNRVWRRSFLGIGSCGEQELRPEVAIRNRQQHTLEAASRLQGRLSLRLITRYLAVLIFRSKFVRSLPLMNLNHDGCLL